METITHSENEMRKSKVPRIETISALTDYIESLVNGQHDYGTCVYAMSLSAVAAFNYAAHKLGVTGFQASCADLDILKRTRGIDGPFMLIKGEDMLYPQNDVHERVSEAQVKWKSWLKEEAEKKLAENNTAHPSVLRHWARLAYNGSNPLESGKIEAKATFLENEFTEEFVTANIAQFKQFGIATVYLRGGGDVSKAQSCREGAGFRINLPVNLQFEYEIDGISIIWSVETEVDGSNGSATLNIDYAKLEALIAKATPNVAQLIQDYVARCRKGE